jgi:hypothetical protein
MKNAIEGIQEAAREDRQLTTLTAWRALCPAEGWTLQQFCRAVTRTLGELPGIEPEVVEEVWKNEFARSASLAMRGLLVRVKGTEDRFVPIAKWGGV